MADESLRRFFVEESSFELPGGTPVEDLEARLQAFVDMVRARHDDEDEVFRWSNLVEAEIQPGVPLYELLYGNVPSLSLDRDLRQALQEVVNRCVQWDDTLATRPVSGLTVDRVPCSSPTLAIVHWLISTNRGAACLPLQGRADRSGIRSVCVGGVANDVHFVAHDADLPEFYRSLFELEDMDPDGYMSNALDAFPRVGFVPGLASQMNRFATKYREVRPLVTTHLGALNDHFQGLFLGHGGKPSETGRELVATCGVDASPESPNTHKNKSAMRKRDVAVEDVLVRRGKVAVNGTVRCEWHTKLKPTTDRIHFHPGFDVAATTEKLLIVGMFVKHLP